MSLCSRTVVCSQEAERSGCHSAFDSVVECANILIEVAVESEVKTEIATHRLTVVVVSNPFVTLRKHL